MTQAGAHLRSKGQSRPKLLGHARCIQNLRSQIGAVGDHDCTVLICGESGTGKELVARHIHAASPRAAGPFIVADCTALPDTLFESQLFGHVKGAFTDAKHATLGLFRAANGGTLFIDEIGELPLHTQATLLRCIQEHSVLPVGAVQSVQVDVRVITATHRDLKEMVACGEFREDLYYRMDVVRLEVPPLRDRRGDILPLAEYFLEAYAALRGTAPKRFADDAAVLLESYAWPGNIRELRNAAERAAVLSMNDILTVADLPDALRSESQRRRTVCAFSPDDSLSSSGKIAPLHAVERWAVERALRETHGNQSRAAALLEVERHRFARMLTRHGLRALANSLRFGAGVTIESGATQGAPPSDVPA